MHGGVEVGKSVGAAVATVGAGVGAGVGARVVAVDDPVPVPLVPEPPLDLHMAFMPARGSALVSV